MDIRSFEISAGEFKERRPVWAWSVTATMLTECDVTTGQGGFYRGKFRSIESLFTEELIHWPSINAREKHPLRVHPTVSVLSTTDEHGSRRTQSNQLV